MRKSKVLIGNGFRIFGLIAYFRHAALVILLFFHLLVLTGCSIMISESDVQNIRPNNFSVLYEWQEVSLPPPHHYEYRINLHSSGQGEVLMTPNYPSAEVPMWTESLTIHPDAVDQLYRLIGYSGFAYNRLASATSSSRGG